MLDSFDKLSTTSLKCSWWIYHSKCCDGVNISTVCWIKHLMTRRPIERSWIKNYLGLLTCFFCRQGDSLVRVALLHLGWAVNTWCALLRTPWQIMRTSSLWRLRLTTCLWCPLQPHDLLQYSLVSFITIYIYIYQCTVFVHAYSL